MKAKYYVVVVEEGLSRYGGDRESSLMINKKGYTEIFTTEDAAWKAGEKKYSEECFVLSISLDPKKWVKLTKNTEVRKKLSPKN